MRLVSLQDRSICVALGDVSSGNGRIRTACPQTYHMGLRLSFNRYTCVQDAASGRRGISRRLVLTANAVLERRPSTYEVAERRQMAGLAALVRFGDEPQWLGLEWADGSATSVYMSTARDALLATLLDAAQVCNGILHIHNPCIFMMLIARGHDAESGSPTSRSVGCTYDAHSTPSCTASSRTHPISSSSDKKYRTNLPVSDLVCTQTAAGRPIAVLPQMTSPGDVVQSGGALSAITGPTDTDAEIERMAVSQLSSAAKEALPAIRQRPGTSPPVGGRSPGGGQTAADANGRGSVSRSVSAAGQQPLLALPAVRMTSASPVLTQWTASEA